MGVEEVIVSGIIAVTVVTITALRLARVEPPPNRFGGPCMGYPGDVECPVCRAPIGRWCQYGEVAHRARYEESPLALAARARTKTESA